MFIFLQYLLFAKSYLFDSISLREGYMKKFLTVAIALFLSTECAFSTDVWINNLRRNFINNSAVIYEIIKQC